MNHQEITEAKLNLWKERNVKMRDFLADYDIKIYNPAIKKLRQQCAKLGHKFSFHNYNLLSSHRIYKCDYCGASKHETDE